MKKSRFSEEQIIGILAEQESGVKVADVCRRHGMSEATFYKWKSKFGGMSVSEAKRLKGLERENSELKKMVAELSLDKPMQNGYIESFNGKLRDECLSTQWFLSLDDARGSIEDWRREYNCERPHSALNNLSPAAYAAGDGG